MITTETINRIVGFTGNGLPVVSLYVRVATDLNSRGAMVRSQVDSRLHEIRPMAEDHALDHDAMMSLRGDIGRIAGMAEEQSWPPGTVALFRAAVAGFLNRCNCLRLCATASSSTRRRGSVRCWRCWTSTTGAVLPWCTGTRPGCGSSTWTRCVRPARCGCRAIRAATTTKLAS
jgi:hypothetical protein